MNTFYDSKNLKKITIITELKSLNIWPFEF